MPGPLSSGLAIWAVRSPFDAAAFRSSLCAAHIMTSSGSKLSAAAVMRYTAGVGLKLRGGSDDCRGSEGRRCGGRLEHAASRYVCHVGRCLLRKARARSIVLAFKSAGSFQGKTAISAFGARDAISMAV